MTSAGDFPCREQPAEKTASPPYGKEQCSTRLLAHTLVLQDETAAVSLLGMPLLCIYRAAAD